MQEEIILNKTILSEEESKRVVEPLQIWFKDKSWYLISYCRNKKDDGKFIVKVKYPENEYINLTL